MDLVTTNIKDMTDPQLQDREQHLKDKLASAEKGPETKSNARDADAGVVLSVTLAAVTGGLSPIVEAVATALYESRKTNSAITPTGSGGSKTRMPGEKKSMSRFADVKPATPAATAAPKTRAINLMAPVAKSASRFAYVPVKINQAVLAQPAGGKVSPLTKEDVGKTALPSAKTAIKADVKKTPKPVLDKLKIKLGEVRAEQEKGPDTPRGDDPLVSKRLEQQIKSGSVKGQEALKKVPMSVQYQLARKMQLKPPTPGM